MLFWLLFRPLVWLQYVQHIDWTNLSPDFALCTLNTEQWKRAELRKLLGLIHIIAPLNISMLVFLLLFLFTLDWQSAIRGSVYTLMLSFIGGMVCSTIISVAFGFIISSVGGLLLGLCAVLPEEMWLELIMFSAFFSASLAGRVLITLSTQTSPPSLAGKFKKFVLGLLVIGGSLFLIGCILVVSVFISYALLDFFGVSNIDRYAAILTAGIWTWLLLIILFRRWLWSMSIALVFSALIAFLMYLAAGIASDDNNLLSMLVIRPAVGSTANGLLFTLLFSLPYLAVRYTIANPWIDVLAGLLGAWSIYLLLGVDMSGLFFGVIGGIFGFGLLGFRRLRPPPLQPKAPELHAKANDNNPLSEKDVPMSGLFSYMTRVLVHILRPGVSLFQRMLYSGRSFIASQALQIAKINSPKLEIDNPYVTGVPLTLHERDIFVGRVNVSTAIEEYLKRGRAAPILLYGQRRIGKTSLLIQLNHLLPDKYLPLFVNLQKIASASDYSGFLYGLSRAMRNFAEKHRGINLSPLTREGLQIDPFGIFNEWLDAVEADTGNHTLVLTFDEFESLVYVFGKNRLDEKLIMGLFRDIIQHRPRFRIIIAGADLLDGFADWMVYLNNMEKVSLGYLQEKDTRRLIEHPTKNFSLKYKADAIQYILDLTRGHPAMVQLLCREIVNLINRADTRPMRTRHLVQIEDVEAVLPRVLKSFATFFIHMTNVSAKASELLCFVAEQGQKAVVPEEILYSRYTRETVDELLKRKVLERTGAGYHFQLELMRRFFVKSHDAASAA
ncbi:MAG: hypothetical protein GY862_26055 [Gammaproteobacteria bacterium]|nr:hypothetical protein [Gammaproteobacteria bacterium]